MNFLRLSRKRDEAPIAAEAQEKAGKVSKTTNALDVRRLPTLLQGSCGDAYHTWSATGYRNVYIYQLLVSSTVEILLEGLQLDIVMSNYQLLVSSTVGILLEGLQLDIVMSIAISYLYRRPLRSFWRVCNRISKCL
ncbi:hypothetical protein TNCV_4814611 [Trichonephila clavipes]|nr:hypothetical protein TNCV_4814611 [Trichonephila clavipes]